MTESPYWIETYTGKALDLVHPDPALIDLYDIAQGLSQACRYTGQCRWHYSVAQHSLGVYRIVRATDSRLGLTALLHDAAEAYLGDWSSPLKAYFRQHAPAALAMERGLEAAIGEKFGVDLVSRNPVIKAADRIMLATERRDLMAGNTCDDWFATSGAAPAAPDAQRIQQISWHAAKGEWLAAVLAELDDAPLYAAVSEPAPTESTPAPAPPAPERKRGRK